MPRLSVHMPVYNGEATVAAALRSTLRAMPKDAELVVWNDGSTDRTIDVIAGVEDRRVRVIESATNVGPGAAARELCARTDSALVARMDADDFCLPGRFRLQLGHMRTGRIDILFSPVVRFSTAPLRVKPSMPLAISANGMPLHLAVMCKVTHPTMMATRDAISSAGGYRAVLAEDYDLWLRACTAGLRVARMAAPTVAYRRHAGQTSFADGYQAAAQSEPELAASYRRFAHQVLGVSTTWVPGTTANAADHVRSIAALKQALGVRARTLAPLERHLLERTMRLLPTPS